MGVEKIEKIEELLQPILGNSKKIIDTKIVPLTAPGENYGSIMLRVDLTLKNENSNEDESLSMVAKLIPESEFFQKIFNVHVSVKTEIAFYDVIVPTLREFQKRRGDPNTVDFFPTLYGARINLNGESQVVDQDAVLLLGNLKIAGYGNIDRYVGFDREGAKFLLRDIARFHAIPLALRILEPGTFALKVKPYLMCFASNEKAEQPDFGRDDAPPAIAMNALKESGKVDGILEKLQRSMLIQPSETDYKKSKFATIAHKDMWINNFMVKFEGGKITSNKLIDFQNYTFDTPIKDLLFFLATSVQLNVLQNHLDELIHYYHEQFIQTLKNLKFPNIDDYNYEDFLKEISKYAGKCIWHFSFFTMIIIYGKKNNKEAAAGGGPPSLLNKDEISPEAKEKVIWLLQEFERRDWINI